jgi:outer membrane protein OmpA-like peptidoglycan-associated protein
MSAGKVKSIEKSQKAPEPSSPTHVFARQFTAATSAGGFEVGSRPQVAGNLAVQRLFRTRAIQAKLTISQPGDPDEQEADLVADRVRRMAESGAINSAPGVVHRKCAACEAGDTTCAKCGEEENLRRKEAPGQASQTGPAVHAVPGGLGLTSAPPIVHEVLSSPGQPLGTTERAFMEPRFGQDFSGVRVHTGAKAAESAAAVQARAYTVGNDIVFGGKESASDLPVLAHELTHVIQQSGGSPTLQRLQYCLDFLEPRRPGIKESSVRDSLRDDAAALGTVETELCLPAASFDPYRPDTQDIDIAIRTPPGFCLQGDGKADVALLNGSTLEVIEVKEATWDSDSGAPAAEFQLRNYLEKARHGRAIVNAYWRARGHPADEITSVTSMPRARLSLLPNPRTINGKLVSLRWCRNGIIVFKVEPPEEKEPEDKPKDKEPPEQGPGASPLPIPSLPELLTLGAKVAALLLADGLLSAALSFVGSFALALTPFLALAALAVGIVFLADKIKSIAHMIAGAAKFVWDTVSSVVALVRDTLKAIGKTIGELAVVVGGLIKDLAEAIAEGLLAAGRGLISGAKWLGGRIAEGAEAVWDWLFGSDVEPMIPNIELPITEEPTMRCGTVAREDALIQIESDILFPFREWELTKLTPEGHAALLKAAAKVLFTPRTDDPIGFLGFTDVIGDPGKNQTLSEQRAAAVADWFVQHGIIPRSKVEIRGLGETEAQAQANDEEGRKKDRRVDILVAKKGSSEKVCW